MVASLFVRNLGKFLVFLPLKLLVEWCNLQSQRKGEGQKYAEKHGAMNSRDPYYLLIVDFTVLKFL